MGEFQGGDGMNISETKMAATRPDRIVTPLSAAPIPSPDVRELMEKAYRGGFYDGHVQGESGANVAKSTVGSSQ